MSQIDNKPTDEVKQDDKLCLSRDFDNSKSSELKTYEYNEKLNKELIELNKILEENNINQTNRIKINKEILKCYYKVDKLKLIRDIIPKYIKDTRTREEIKQQQQEIKNKWREEHKDKIKEYNMKNKDRIREYQKNYYLNHPDKYEEMKEKRKINSREYYNKNKINILNKMKMKYNNNKPIEPSTLSRLEGVQALLEPKNDNNNEDNKPNEDNNKPTELI